MNPTLRLRAPGVLGLALVLGLIGCGNQQPPAPATPSASAAAQPAVAKPAGAASATETPKRPSDKPRPSLRIATIDGSNYDLGSQRGHWVVVNFWATFCGPCLQEIPDLSAFIRKRKDVSVIGLDYEEIEKPELLAFLGKHKSGYPIAMVDTYHPPQDFDAPRLLPTSYLIGPDGTVVHKFYGPITIKELEQQIDRAKPAS